MESNTNKEKPLLKDWRFWVLAVIIIVAIVESMRSKNNNYNIASNNLKKSTNSSATSTNKDQRQVTGKATDLGTGVFQCGKDIQAGLYDATIVTGKGHFEVYTKNRYSSFEEVFSSEQNPEAAKVRTKIVNGDKIYIARSINTMHFQPVATSFVKSVQRVTIYCGIWTVGEDIAAGRYVVAPVSGSADFIIIQNGVPVTDDTLGEASQIKSDTVELRDGDTILIKNLNQVTLTPSK
jgi:hypothetical protein